MGFVFGFVFWLARAMSVGRSFEFPFQDPELSRAARVNDLVARLTLSEKAGQMLHEAPGIERLGVPPYNWWNEALHGVARAGIATVFPQAIGLGAMWSPRRLHEVAVAVSDEARAKHHEFARHADYGYYKGLTFWSPNINILRDPRWGRGHETYGECPYLTSRLGVAFCTGLQGEDPEYLKLVATPKHFAVHSGPEAARHGFDAQVSPKDLRETYLPAFHACITEAKAASIMGAYNRVNGEPCCGSETLLKRILREEWQFQGYVVSDCWAVRDFHENHHVTASFAESAAMAVKAGCDLNCGCTYEHIPAAVEQGLLSEAELDVCLTRLFDARMRLGMFDPPGRVPFAATPYEVNDSARHAELALVAARESMVLLKNDGVLPLSRELRSIAVIGPNADDASVLVANYHGTPSQPVTPLAGIRAAVSQATKVWYAQGCKRTGTKTDGVAPDGNLSEALAMAERADVVVLCLGLGADIEGEQGDAGNSDASGDRRDLGLPGLQQALLEQVTALGKPVVLVLLAGSALAVGWADQNVSAILNAWYPGQAGGTALADVLFGNYAPAGRLPVTFPRSVSDLPSFENYAMKGRTYRYLEAEPLYPFGFGLSYTRFEYSALELSATSVPAQPDTSVTLTVCVKNTGTRASDEVVQIYVKDLDASCTVPRHALSAFERIMLAAGESRRLSFTLRAREFSLIDDRGKRVLEPGRFRISAGGSQPDERSVALMGQRPLTLELELTGTPVELPY
jgi:beta-glucosidase